MQNNKYEQFKGQPRLPKFAIPKRYDLILKPDLIDCKFTGTVEIDIDIKSETKLLVLNAAELTIHHDSVWYKDTTSHKIFRPLAMELREEDEIVVFEFNETLPLSEGTLGIGFDGTLNDKMKGFYRSTYEINGEKKNMAVTQFEPANARKCFPCWDDPAAKATFKVTLVVPSELVALSNMPIIDEKPEGNLKTLVFQESPIMSTYLAAVVVGSFDFIEGYTTDGIKVRVYCPVGKRNQGSFALDIAVKSLDLYRLYFKTPYPLPKLDMVSIPDFQAGAMENYGLVTYRETELLYDGQHSSAANKQQICIIVAHELAHQWFGNLVTMEWWTDIWLNEGFATWMSYWAADRLFPEWNIWTQFVGHSNEGLRLDGLAASHPIEVEIKHPSETFEIFDAISYRKGSSIVRMLQTYLGADCFQRSLASYIEEYAWSNAKTDNLWLSLEKGSGKPVNMLMTSWTKQTGYPVICVQLRDHKLEFDQSQFLQSGASGEGQWIVPITLCCGSYEVQRTFLLQMKTESLNVAELVGSSGGQGNHSKWIKLNVDQAGFYRVKYDDELQVRLRYAIEASALSATDRYGILDDCYALSMASKQSLSSLLSLMSAYRKELDYTVFSHLITISFKVARITSDATPELSVYIKQFFTNLFHNTAEKLGWDQQEGESHLDEMLRGEVLTALVIFGDAPTQKEALRRFHAYVDDRNTPLLSPNTRKAAYVAVMRTVTTSDRQGYDTLLKIYRETDLVHEKIRILGSLASCPDPGIVLEVLNFLLSSEVRRQDVSHGLEVSWEGAETAWNWLKENWDHILNTYGPGFLLTRYISRIVSNLSSTEKVAEVEEFFATRTKPFMVRVLQQSLEWVDINANWVRSIREEKSFEEVVKERSTNMTFW